MECTTLKAGWWVVLTLHRDTAPLRSYAGQVKDVDDRGVRVGVIDWRAGTASDFDLFVPWTSIASAMVVTDPASLPQFEERAGQWQRYAAALGGEYDRERAHQNRGRETSRPREGPRGEG